MVFDGACISIMSLYLRKIYYPFVLIKITVFETSKVSIIVEMDRKYGNLLLDSGCLEH